MTAFARRCAAIAKLAPAYSWVPGASDGSLRVEALGPHHNRSSFASGVEPLDRYLRSHASQDARKNMAAPFGAGAAGRGDQRATTRFPRPE